MSRLTIIDVRKIPRKIKGKLQRVMLEIRAGLFVGRIPTKIVRSLWAEIVGTRGSAVIVTATQNEAGYRVGTHGAAPRQVIDNEGIPLVQYTRKKRVSAGT